MLTKGEMLASPLFADINAEEFGSMMACFRARQRSFGPDERICDLSAASREEIGVLEKGRASLIRIDEEGVATVLEDLEPGGVFGLPFFAGPVWDSVEVVCRTACEVLFIDYDCLLKRCENACTHHSVLVRNMLRLTADKAQSLAERIDVFTRRSIREKLLCFFRQMARREGGGSFTMPFTLSVLADYIAADRSAMMRELKRLKTEGLVSSEGRRFTLASME